MKILIVNIFLLSTFACGVFAQNAELAYVAKDSLADATASKENEVEQDLSKSSRNDMKRMKVGDQWMYALVTAEDTIFIADLEGASITMPRTFKNNDEKRRYYKLKRSAQKVYPYAVKAMELYRESKRETAGMSKRKRRRHNKRKTKELKEEFEKPLKKLTKTQGKVLIAMIERELDTSFFNVIKELRSGFTAQYWNVLGSFNGYKIKQQYDPEADPLMEAVLTDFDIDLAEEEEEENNTEGSE